MKHLCQICKSTPSSVHQYTIFGAGHHTSSKLIHMCIDCAIATGLNIVAPGVPDLPQAKSPKQLLLEKLGQGMLEPMKDLLAKLSNDEDLDADFPMEEQEIADEGLVCPDCGTTELDFKSTQRFGCPKDYELFEDLVGDVLESIHGTTEHSEISKLKLLDSLKKDLKQATDDELYEEAAMLRDQIRLIEDELNNQEN